MYYENELYHHGIKGQKWGVRRYQNSDGTLTAAGKRRYVRDLTPQQRRSYNKQVAARTAMGSAAAGAIGLAIGGPISGVASAGATALNSVLSEHNPSARSSSRGVRVASRAAIAGGIGAGLGMMLGGPVGAISIGAVNAGVNALMAIPQSASTMSAYELARRYN